MDMNTFFLQYPGLLFCPPFREQLAAYAKHEEEVIRVCTVYPHKVTFKTMKQALKALDYHPTFVYMQLVEGKTLPELDTLLLGPGPRKERS